MPPLLWAALLAALPPDPRPSPAPARVALDPAGRVQARIEVHPDGSWRAIRYEYWPDSTVLRRSEESERDGPGATTAWVAQEFDERGRLFERRDWSVDAAGRAHGQRARYSYAPDGRRTETSGPLAPLTR